MFKLQPNAIPKEAGLTADVLKAIARHAERVSPGPQVGAITVAAVDAQTIRRWNREYRKKDKETDVLSFRYAPDFANAEADEVVGEILIHPGIVAEQAHAYGNTLRAEWCKLVTHGLFHILGFDHETDAQYRVMSPLERGAADMLREKFMIDIH